MNELLTTSEMARLTKIHPNQLLALARSNINATRKFATRMGKTGNWHWDYDAFKKVYFSPASKGMRF